MDQFVERLERGATTVRSMVVWSDAYGLFGRCDTVELATGEAPVPIEHKSGRRALAPAIMQLAAQAICLEEMFGKPVTHGAVWLHGRRRRREIQIDQALRQQALGVAQEIRGRRSTSGLPSAVFDRPLTLTLPTATFCAATARQGFLGAPCSGGSVGER